MRRCGIQFRRGYGHAASNPESGARVQSREKTTDMTDEQNAHIQQCSTWRIHAPVHHTAADEQSRWRDGIPDSFYNQVRYSIPSQFTFALACRNVRCPFQSTRGLAVCGR